MVQVVAISRVNLFFRTKERPLILLNLLKQDDVKCHQSVNKYSNYDNY